MGCICSKGSSAEDYVAENDKDDEINKCSIQVIAPSRREEIIVEVTKPSNDGSVRSKSKPGLDANVGAIPVARVEESGKTIIIERPKGGHHRRSTTIDFTFGGGPQTMSRIVSMPHGAKGEQAAAGWPSWLSSVAGEAIQGWVPRSAESFQKLNKIGQGTYSSVYQARDLTTNKIVAMKKVRFVNMDPESVRFMAREICILRRLDHPNIMKLEALVASKISGSFYLVFEYMEHDLAGLLASPKVKFTESQIKCYMQQLFHGLEHCHSRGVLHRDIKGANLLVDNNGILKIGDFGLANFFQPNQKEPLTSRVVTLWYRAPELLLGATEYGVAIDMWSAGCILAELFAGKPIMPGRTEVEQMHKIFKLCGSPSEEYWRKSKLPHATSFKPQQPYRRCVSETFKEFPSSALALIDVLLSIEPEERGTATSALNSEFFTTKPLPCDTFDLPKYPPSKEFDAKLREEEARRQKAESLKGRGGESIRKSSRPSKGVPTPEFDDQGQGQPSKCISVKYNLRVGGGTGYSMQPCRVNSKNRLSHSSSVLHPNAVGYQWSTKGKEASQTVSMRNFGSSRHRRELMNQGSQRRQGTVHSSSIHQIRDDRGSGQETMVYVPKRNRIHCSGPLMPPGGNMEDILKEHERQIQEAVRKTRGDKSTAKRP